MDLVNRIVVIISTSKSFFEKINWNLSGNFEKIERKTTASLNQIFRIHPVSCVLLHVDDKNLPGEMHIAHIKKKFTTIPFIAILNNEDLELAHKCGKLGIDKVLIMDQVEHLTCEVEKLIDQKSIFISFSELGIIDSEVTYSDLLLDTLEILEKNYIRLSSITRIAEMMGISECTLSREFQKFNLPGPKKLLMYLKVYHASVLMLNKGLNIREIANLSGFSNDKRLAECFLRVFNKPPGECRNFIDENTMAKVDCVNMLKPLLFKEACA